jgi:hypothetical protein
MGGYKPMLVVKDISKLLADLPRGAWVALSHDQERVVSYGNDLEEVVRKAKESGEEHPVVTRIPQTDSQILIV